MVGKPELSIQTVAVAIPVDVWLSFPCPDKLDLDLLPRAWLLEAVFGVSCPPFLWTVGRSLSP